MAGLWKKYVQISIIQKCTVCYEIYCHCIQFAQYRDSIHAVLGRCRYWSSAPVHSYTADWDPASMSHLTTHAHTHAYQHVITQCLQAVHRLFVTPNQQTDPQRNQQHGYFNIDSLHVLPIILSTFAGCFYSGTAPATIKHNILKTRSIWKMLGPFAKTSHLMPIQQMSLAVLSHAACATARRLRIDVYDANDDNNAWQRVRYGPMEWAQ